MSTPLFERLGGMEAIMAAVDIFYEKVLADELLADFFTGIDMDKQIKKQIAFMATAFNGPQEYKGRDMRAAHRHLVQSKGLNDAHFDAVAMHLKATLEELDVAPDLVDEALGIVASTRNEVLNR
jgi:hemoglobin